MRVRTRCAWLAGMLLLAAACDTPPPAERPGATVGQEPTATASPTDAPEPSFAEYPVPEGSHPHDVAPAPDGGVWYTAQGSGELGLLDPATGRTRHIPLGAGSAPHGVIVGPEGLRGSRTEGRTPSSGWIRRPTRSPRSRSPTPATPT